MKKWRNTTITIFVILWCLVFHYESVRHFYLEPLIGRALPKVRFLFPPAGWIMFFQVDSAYGSRQVFGIKDEQAIAIDPHEIFKVRTIGYDNIHRGVISSAASPSNAYQFCRHLEKQFGDFDDFIVTLDYYPDFIKEPNTRLQQALYQCSQLKGR